MFFFETRCNIIGHPSPCIPVMVECYN